MVIQSSPPPLPSHWMLNFLFASKDQRIRAGLIDHFIDSSVWFWLFILVMGCSIQLEFAMDARSFLRVLIKQFPISMGIIGLLLVIDFLLCVSRGQSIGQLINRIYKVGQHTASQCFVVSVLEVVKFWLHGLISRCLGMPLLCVYLVICLILNPMIIPINLHDFSLVEPEGAYRLMTFLLNIIGTTLFLFGLFLPAGLGFIRTQLPTWYDQLFGVQVREKPKKSHS